MAFVKWALVVAVLAWLLYAMAGEIMLERELLEEAVNDDVMHGTAPVLLFDGVCNLCNGVVNFLIEVDDKAIFRFAALQSPIAEKMLADHNVPNDLSTVVLIESGRPFLRSTAALRVAKHLGFPYSLLYYTFILLPEQARDLGYLFVATSRYAVFGKQDECLLPSPSLQARFLDFTFSQEELEDCDIQTTRAA